MVPPKPTRQPFATILCKVKERRAQSPQGAPDNIFVGQHRLPRLKRHHTCAWQRTTRPSLESLAFPQMSLCRVRTLSFAESLCSTETQPHSAATSRACKSAMPCTRARQAWSPEAVLPGLTVLLLHDLDRSQDQPFGQSPSQSAYRASPHHLFFPSGGMCQ